MSGFRAPSRVQLWRSSFIEDDELPKLTKLALHTLGALMNAEGVLEGWGRQAIARLASMSAVAFDSHVERAEELGWIDILPRKVPTSTGALRRPGGKGSRCANRYSASFPQTANAVSSSLGERANFDPPKSKETALKSKRGLHALDSLESLVPKKQWKENCLKCQKQFATDDEREVFCVEHRQTLTEAVAS